MIADDFEYAGKKLSDYGMTIGYIDSNDPSGIISTNAEMNFNLTPTQHGRRWLKSNVSYDSVVSTTFGILKFDCNSARPSSLSQSEQREIARWLQRSDFQKFKPIVSANDTYDNICFFGSFGNLEPMYVGYDIVGYQVTFTANTPFALMTVHNIPDESHEILTNEEDDGLTEMFHEVLYLLENTDMKFVIEDESDEVGYIYPILEVTCLSAGNLVLENELENRKTIVKNCSSGETLRFTPDLIVTSSNHPNLMNDFNFTFFRIANTQESRTNTIRCSIPCKIEYWYYPIVKGVAF